MPYVSIDQNSIYYEKRGSGIPILFIHPPLLTSANFRYQQEQLSRHYQVVTFDIRGHGQSPASSEPVTYEQVTLDIIALLDHLKIKKAFIAGYSTGGAIALNTLLQYPNRCIGGILISTMSEASDQLLRNRIRTAISLSKWKFAQSLLLLSVTLGNSDRPSTFLDLFRGSKKGNRRNIRQYYQSSLHYNCTSLLAQITAPVLLLYGGKDHDFARYRHILNEGLRQSTMIILDDVRHQLPTKAYLRLNHYIHEWAQLVLNLKPYV